MNGKAKWVRVSWMAGALLPLLVGITSAVNTGSTAPGTNQPMQDDRVATPSESTAKLQPHLDKAKDFIGAKIVNERGEPLGTIADVVLTPNRDGINYVVLSYDAGWATAEKHFAIPWSQFGHKAGDHKSGENGKTFILKGNISKADLDRAPGFDKNNWPAVASDNWLGIERGSAMTPSGRAPSMPAPPSEGMAAAPQPSPDRGMRGDTTYGAAPATDIQNLKLSKVLGTDIRNLQDENLGKLDDVMIDLNHGKVAYGIVAMRHGFLGLDKDFVAVPWSALDWTGQADIARLDVNRDTLMALAFDADNFPNLEDPQYSRQLHERFGATPYGEALGFVPGEEKKSGDLPSVGVTPPKSGTVPPDSGMRAPNAGAPNSGVIPPDSGMTAPNADARNSGAVPPNSTTPNSAAPRMIDHKDNHKNNHKGEHAFSYNPDAVQTIHGTVSKVDTRRVEVEGTAMEYLRLTVKADDGRTILVHVGPRSFVDRQNIIFNEGDPVTITGSLAKMGEREVLVASRIQTSGRALDLRTREGAPLWSREQARAPSPSDRSAGQPQGSYRY
jgi:sporulation protein YlmC with PRC-barrel domain